MIFFAQPIITLWGLAANLLISLSRTKQFSNTVIIDVFHAFANRRDSSNTLIRAPFAAASALCCSVVFRWFYINFRPVPSPALLPAARSCWLLFLFLHSSKSLKVPEPNEWCTAGSLGYFHNYTFRHTQSHIHTWG